MDSDTMTIYVSDGLEDVIMLQLSSSATLDDLKKKHMEKGGKSDRYGRYVSNGKVLFNSQRLRDQGVQSGGRVERVGKANN